MPLEINLGVEGVGKSLQDLERMARIYDRLDRVQQRRTTATERAERATAREAARQERAARAAERAAARQERLAYQRSFAGRTERVLRSTRFDIGGVSPLAGQAFDLIESLGGKVTGPLIAGTLGIVAAGVAARELARAAQEATTRINDFSKTQTLAGGTAGQMGMLRAMGLTGAQAAGAANQLRERLATDPIAMMASRSGMQLPSWMGSQNNATLLIRELQGLRAERNPENQLRRARMLGLEEFLETLRVSEPVWQRLMVSAAAHSGVMEKNAQGARDLAGEQLRLNLEWERLTTTLGAKFIPALTTATIRLADMADAAGRIGSGQFGGQDFGRLALPVIIGALKSMPPTVIAGFTLEKMFNKFFPAGGDSATAAAKAQTDATLKLDRTMMEHAALLKQQITGGGPRAANAVPVRMSGEMIRRQIEMRAFFGGAWAL